MRISVNWVVVNNRDEAFVLGTSSHISAFGPDDDEIRSKVFTVKDFTTAGTAFIVRTISGERVDHDVVFNDPLIIKSQVVLIILINLADCKTR